MTRSGEHVEGRPGQRFREACIVAACLVSAIAYLALSQGIRNHAKFLLDSMDKVLSVAGMRG